MFSPQIDELLEHENLSVEEIINWLQNYKYLRDFYINESKCQKWSYFLINGDKPYPCFCEQREKECFFIEIYYELERIVNFHNNSNYVKELTKICQTVINSADKKTVKSWQYNHEFSMDALNFDINLEILYSKKPFKTLVLKLNENDFKYVNDYKLLYKKTFYRISKMTKYFK